MGAARGGGYDTRKPPTFCATRYPASAYCADRIARSIGWEADAPERIALVQFIYPLQRRGERCVLRFFFGRQAHRNCGAPAFGVDIECWQRRDDRLELQGKNRASGGRPTGAAYLKEYHDAFLSQIGSPSLKSSWNRSTPPDIDRHKPA